ncbi:MAG: prepilin peptidase [bacterium]|nr:prepilin peptidase [bacterium]
MHGDYLVFAILFIFGAIIGSFLNVVILRFGTGMPIATGRSKCFSCGKTLSWYELVPILSFVVQWGKCRSCGARLSVQYPIVELAGAVALPLAYVSTTVVSGLTQSLILFALLAVLLFIYIVIFVYDLRHKLIPDAFSYTAALVALAMIAVKGWASGFIDLYAVIAGPTFFLFFFAFWYFSQGRWMGLGDGKLALSVGWALGIGAGTAALLFAFWIGAIVALLIMVLQRTGVFKGPALGLRSELPFGPFIVIGFVLSLAAPSLFPYLMSLLAV